jgi:type IV secretory pathway VirB2 component (pilin)
MTIVVAAVLAGAAIAALGEPAWAQGVTLGGGGGGANFVAWLMGPAGIGSLIGLFIALCGIGMMAGRHSWEGILFVVVGAIIAGAANTIAGYFA